MTHNQPGPAECEERLQGLLSVSSQLRAHAQIHRQLRAHAQQIQSIALEASGSDPKRSLAARIVGVCFWGRSPRLVRSGITDQKARNTVKSCVSLAAGREHSWLQALSCSQRLPHAAFTFAKHRRRGSLKLFPLREAVQVCDEEHKGQNRNSPKETVSASVLTLQASGKTPRKVQRIVHTPAQFYAAH